MSRHRISIPVPNVVGDTGPVVDVSELGLQQTRTVDGTTSAKLVLAGL